MSFSRHSTRITKAVFFTGRGQENTKHVSFEVSLQGYESREKEMDVASGTGLSSWEGRQQFPQGPDNGSEMSLELKPQE